MIVQQLLDILHVQINGNPELTGLYLILAKIFSAIFLLPGALVTVLSGSLLGVFWGSIVSVVGNVIGATCAFLIGRYFFKNYIQTKVLPKYPKIYEYEHKFFQRGFKTVLFLRLVPLFPFNILNYILGVTEVKFRDYFLATAIGIIPGTVAFVYFGESVKMLSFFSIFLAILGIVGLASLGKFWKV